MAAFEYGGGGEDLSSTRPFDSDGYMGFDPRLPSQRFDASQRFDESFRAPDHFNPGFVDDPKVEIEDEYKSANGFSYHQADVQPGYGFEDELAGHGAGVPPGYSPSFEPDLHSDFAQSPDYTDEHGANGNGYGAAEEEDTLFSSLPPQGSDGPLLPPPEDMKEEGFALREWKRENAIRLEEKERKERERLARVIEEADDFKDAVYVKRKAVIESGKKSNREKEKIYLVNQENFHKEADKHYWKAVAELIPNELPTIDKGGKKDKKDKDRKPGIVAIKGPKPGKPTDVTRLRQVLIKLKHTPPPHMKYKPPPPPPEAEKDKEKAKDKDAKDAKDAKDPKDAKDAKDKVAAPEAEASTATPAPDVPSPSDSTSPATIAVTA